MCLFAKYRLSGTSHRVHVKYAILEQFANQMWAHQCGTANDQYFQISSSVKRDDLQRLSSSLINKNCRAFRKKRDGIRVSYAYKSRLQITSAVLSVRGRWAWIQSGTKIQFRLGLKGRCKEKPSNFRGEIYRRKTTLEIPTSVMSGHSEYPQMLGFYY